MSYKNLLTYALWNLILHIDHSISCKSDVQERITQGVGKGLNVYKCRVSSFSN
jgi:hypothetical protein